MWGELGISFGGPRGLLGRFLSIVAVAGFCLLGAMTATAQAATDSLFAAPSATGAGDCSSPANACSIATAVTNANAEPVADSVVIELANGTYLLPSPSPTALSITFAGPSLTIEAESGTPTLDGENLVRLLSVGSTSNVTLDGLEIEFGSTTGNGGGVSNSGTLTIKHSMFSSNSASNGGGISNVAGATLTVQTRRFRTTPPQVSGAARSSTSGQPRSSARRS